MVAPFQRVVRRGFRSRRRSRRHHGRVVWVPCCFSDHGRRDIFVRDGLTVSSAAHPATGVAARNRDEADESAVKHTITHTKKSEPIGLSLTTTIEYKKESGEGMR